MEAFAFPMDAGTFFLMVFYSLVFSAPVYACNSFANLSKFIPFLGVPVDFGKSMKDGKRIFGDHKTWRGIIFGIIFGVIAGLIVWYVAYKQHGIFTVYPWFIGFFMSIGDHFADLLGSFVKRRIGIKSGGAFPLYDQGSWMITGFVFSFPFIWAEINLWFYFVTSIIVAPLLHFILNIPAYWLGLKDVWY
jgi:CDP-2,3-bis-(O-geranylgeranyl)-sn-glycerol synthase